MQSASLHPHALHLEKSSFLSLTLNTLLSHLSMASPILSFEFTSSFQSCVYFPFLGICFLAASFPLAFTSSRPSFIVLLNDQKYCLRRTEFMEFKSWQQMKKKLARLRLDLRIPEARGYTPLQPTESAGTQHRSARRLSKLEVWCVAITPSCLLTSD